MAVTATATAAPTPATGPTIVDLDFTVTVGIWGVKPQCTGLSTIQVPANTTVVYCYKVFNNTAQTPSVHTLVDSVWGVLLDQMLLPLAPGESYSYTTSHTIAVTTTNTATWTAIQAGLDILARSKLSNKTVVQPNLVAPRWRTAWLGNTGPQWTTNRSATATVYISGPTDDQDHDGIPDIIESANDFDGDNLPNFLDEDADNDGAPDAQEGTADQDQDGQMDFIDPENGLPDPTNIGSNPQEPMLVNKLYLPLIAR